MTVMRGSAATNALNSQTNRSASIQCASALGSMLARLAESTAKSLAKTFTGW